VGFSDVFHLLIIFQSTICSRKDAGARAMFLSDVVRVGCDPEPSSPLGPWGRLVFSLSVRRSTVVSVVDADEDHESEYVVLYVSEAVLARDLGWRQWLPLNDVDPCGSTREARVGSAARGLFHLGKARLRRESTFKVSIYALQESQDAECCGSASEEEMGYGGMSGEHESPQVLRAFGDDSELKCPATLIQSYECVLNTRNPRLVPEQGEIGQGAEKEDPVAGWLPRVYILLQDGTTIASCSRTRTKESSTTEVDENTDDQKTDDQKIDNEWMGGTVKGDPNAPAIIGGSTRGKDADGMDARQTERASIKIIRERASCIHSLQAKWTSAHDICTQRKQVIDRIHRERQRERTSARHGADDSPVRRAASYILLQELAQIPENLSDQIHVRSQALSSTLQALSQASNTIQSSSAALVGDTRVDDLQKRVEARQALAFADITKTFLVECIDDEHACYEQRTGHHHSRAGRINAGISAMDFDSKWSGDQDDRDDRDDRDDQDDHQENVMSSMHRKGYPRVSICGCSLDPSTWKYALNPNSDAAASNMPTAAADRDASIFLGYAARIVVMTSDVLDLPLRYPISLRGSHSTIADAEPDTKDRREFPLFVANTNEGRVRFAIAVFLLYKDIVQILSFLMITRGLSTNDTRRDRIDAVCKDKDLLGNALVCMLHFFEPHDGNHASCP
jgi:hypothetical protein